MVSSQIKTRKYCIPFWGNLVVAALYYFICNVKQYYFWKHITYQFWHKMMPMTSHFRMSHSLYVFKVSVVQREIQYKKIKLAISIGYRQVQRHFKLRTLIDRFVVTRRQAVFEESVADPGDITNRRIQRKGQNTPKTITESCSSLWPDSTNEEFKKHNNYFVYLTLFETCKRKIHNLANHSTKQRSADYRKWK